MINKELIGVYLPLDVTRYNWLCFTIFKYKLYTSDKSGWLTFWFLYIFNFGFGIKFPAIIHNAFK